MNKYPDMKNYILLLIIAALTLVSPVSEAFSMEPADSTEADWLYKKADDFWRDVQYDSSNFYYEKASSIYEKFKSWKNFIECQKNIGTNYRFLGNYSQAFTHLNSGLDAVSYLKENQDSLRAELYNSIGTIYYEKGNYDKAYKYYKNMLDINEKVFGEEHANTGKGYQNVGLIYYRTGNYDKALQYFKKAISIWDSTLTEDNPYFANCYTNIANVYFLNEDYKKSIEYNEKALKIWIDKLGEDHPYVAISYNNLADEYSHTGNYSRALEYDYKAMQIRRDFAGEESRDVANSYAGIGNVFAKMGNLNNAAYFLNKAVSTYHKTDPSNLGLADAYIYTGDLLLKKRDFSSAAAYYDSALYVAWPGYNADVSNPDYLTKIPSAGQLLTALTGKGNAYFEESENSGDLQELEKALDAYNLASEITEKIKTGFSKEEPMLMLTKRAYQINKMGAAAALRLYDISKDRNYIEAAFKFSERNKAGVIAESIAESDVQKYAGVPDSLLSREKELKSDLILYQTKQAEAEEANNLQAIGDNRQILFETQRDYNALMTDLEQNFPAYYKLKHPDELTSSRQIRDLLPAGAAAVEYFTGDSSVTIFTLTKSSINAVSVKCDSVFFDRIRRFRESLPKMNYLEYLSSASELYTKLIEPIKGLLGDTKKLYIIPDYFLSYLPFEALLTKPHPRRFNGDFSQLPYLINDYEISYQYSGLLLKESLLQRNDNQDNTFAGFAPVFSDKPEDEANIAALDNSLPGIRNLRSEVLQGGKLTSLPETETEVKSIGDLFKEHDYPCDLYLHERSTEGILHSDRMTGYKFIHLAAPGFINEDNPKLSGLMFYRDSSDTLNDGILSAGDVYNLTLKADLLVISAYDSKPGAVVNGEGIYALTRSFLYAGARNLVVSLWQVSDKSTSVFMILFYKNILNGMDYSSALRKAKLDLIRGGIYSYPLDWSPFILAGL